MTATLILMPFCSSSSLYISSTLVSERRSRGKNIRSSHENPNAHNLTNEGLLMRQWVICIGICLKEGMGREPFSCDENTSDYEFWIKLVRHVLFSFISTIFHMVQK